MWLFKFVFVRRKNLEVGVSKGPEEKFDQHDLLHHQNVLHNTLPPLPLHLLLIIIILLLPLLILLMVEMVETKQNFKKVLFIF